MRYKFHENRLVTLSIAAVSDRLALCENGFFFNGEYYECFACGLLVPIEYILEDAEPKIKRLHGDFSPNCSYLSGKEPDLDYVNGGDVKVYNQRAIIVETQRVPGFLKSRKITFENGIFNVLETEQRRTINLEKMYKLFKHRMNR